MTIDEIKCVSIVQYLEIEGYKHAYIQKGNYFYLSPIRAESTPSFNVSLLKNLWHDYGLGEGGNIINLVQRMNPAWSDHEVLTYLEKKIKEHHLQFAEDYSARSREEQERISWKLSQAPKNTVNDETVIERVVNLGHPYLRDYIINRRIDFELAKEYCKEVHYSVKEKHFYAIAFENIEGGWEVRNKYSKRSIGKKSISIVNPTDTQNNHYCVFEGFFDMLTYATIKKWMINLELCIEYDCDYIVLNSVSNIKVLLPHLQGYDFIHCYLDNDDAGALATSKIMNAYSCQCIDESKRYSNYKDINDVINGNIKTL